MPEINNRLAAAIALAVRMKCAQDGALPALFFTPEEIPGALALSAFTAEEVFAKLTPAADTTAVAITGLGTYELRRKHRPGRLSGKIAVVTGSAQGFGDGIARDMMDEGAYMVIADLNYDLARQNTESLNARYGEGSALAVKVDVGNEESVASMVEQTVLHFGGLDIFVSNAGILKAGSLEEMTLQSFELVTKVNYTAFFLCAKYASAVMRAQREYLPGYTSDIIQINSKSGLEGSNKNFAYAGSKFGGIGLVQSFAKELVEYGIKVNAICPGNFLDGPLWTDPEKGLFVQYLNAGKVPGAKTIEDVKRSYEARVPMNRGCFPKDVSRAIYYCVEQAYETGQAIPVTGGQNMLK